MTNLKIIFTNNFYLEDYSNVKESESTDRTLAVEHRERDTKMDDSKKSISSLSSDG